VGAQSIAHSQIGEGINKKKKISKNFFLQKMKNGKFSKNIAILT